MTRENVECRRCGSAMEQGYVLDQIYGGWKEEKWSPGEPKKHWWGIDKPGPSIAVRTLRCPSCGVLESYAWSEEG